MTDYMGAPVVVNAPQIPAGLILPVQGRDGTSITIEGVVATYADLPSGLGLADRGALYIVQADTLGYVWSGVSWPADGQGVEIRGPQGNSVTSVAVSGTSLVFSFAEGPTQSVPVPALVQAAADAAAAQAARAGAESARDAADVSEAAAGSSATAAAGSATAASTAKTGAETAKTAAETARDDADASEAAALAAKGSAEAAATAAAGSASAAATSESTATGAAATATADATSAAGSATAAASSAAAAAQDADDADAARILAEQAAEDAQGAGGVPTTRQVIAGTGLAGGGALGSDVTLTLSAGTQASLTLAGSASQPGHTHVMADITDLSDSLIAAFDGKVDKTSIGQPDGVAPLDSSAKIPAVHLPSYVDDVLEFATVTALPATGEAGKIYTTLDTNRIYRWSGSAYVEIAASPGSTDAVPEGTLNRYYTDVRARAAMVGSTPFDVGFVHTGDAARKVGLGGNAAGIRIPRSVTFSSLLVEFATPDASGTSTVVVKRNGTAVAGTSVSITGGNTSGGASGPWTFAALDQLTVEITAVGGTPGKGCVVNLTGVC
ncbi:hypothetical protein ACFWQG_12980 [Rhodococcus sp. NPDC058532]|uniref:hypothetical protein n=1 Tax=Rhodococcus sp. NPDC058532 TaxID=3346540 RepID=UPI00364E86FD